MTAVVLRANRRDRLSTRRRVVAAGAIVAAGVSLTACGIGKTNETQHEHEVEQAASLTSGQLHINDVYITPVGEAITPASGGLSLAPSEVPIVSPPASTPAPTTTSSAGSVSGYLVASVTNGSGTASDRVLGVSLGGSAAGAKVALAPTSANTTVPPNGILTFNDPAQTTKGPFLVIGALPSPLRIGTTVPVTFSLQGEGRLPTMQVPVISSYFGTPPASPPVPTGSPSASLSPSRG